MDSKQNNGTRPRPGSLEHLEELPPNVIIREWHGLYAEGWGDDMTPEAFCHPAKAQPALARKIYRHALAQGYLLQGDIVLDPFAGVAGFARHAIQNSIHFIGVELEQKFVDLGLGYDCPGFSPRDWRRLYGRGQRTNYRHGHRWCPRCAKALDTGPKYTGIIPWHEPHRYEGNIEMWARRYAPWYPLGQAVLVQGDSRFLLQILAQTQADAAISSPPYVDSVDGSGEGPGARYDSKYHLPENSQKKSSDPGYGVTPGQMGAMPEGNVDAVVSSPPFGEGSTRDRTPFQDGEIANFMNRAYTADKHGETPGNLAHLDVQDGFDGAVSSPPFESSLNSQDEDFVKNRLWARDPKTGQIRPRSTAKSDAQDYGHSEGQIGNDAGETFWGAAREIVEQVYQALAPGAVAIWVTGDFVRQGRRVLFGRQWMQLCEACGFETLEWIVAWKVEDRGTQLGLFGNDKEKRVERLSFFRRLANRKNPENAIENEDVIVMRKPEETGNGKD